VSLWKRAGREPRQLITEWHTELQRTATARGDRVEMRMSAQDLAGALDEVEPRAAAARRASRLRSESCCA